MDDRLCFSVKDVASGGVPGKRKDSIAVFSFCKGLRYACFRNTYILRPVYHSGRLKGGRFAARQKIEAKNGKLLIAPGCFARGYFWGESRGAIDLIRERCALLTEFEKELLNILQTKLPVSERPFADMAQVLQSEEKTVIETLRDLQRRGYVRKMGPFFDSAKLGYIGTLVAAKVKTEWMESVAQAINQYSGVTHNYEREGDFNLWFTLLTPDKESQVKILREIRSFPGVENLIELPANRKYKISVQFMLK